MRLILMEQVTYVDIWPGLIIWDTWRTW